MVDGGINGPKSMACEGNKISQRLKGYGCNRAPILHPKITVSSLKLTAFAIFKLLYITIPHILQKIRDRKKKRENFGFHIRCNASELV